MGRHRTFSDVQKDSRNAVAVAGTRSRAGKIASAHHWTPRVGKTGEDEIHRPGKTAKARHG